MEYRNKKTGFSVFSECKISGGDWELVTMEDKAEKEAQQETPVVPPASVAEPEPVVAPEPDDQTGNPDIDALRKKDIIPLLLKYFGSLMTHWRADPPQTLCGKSTP